LDDIVCLAPPCATGALTPLDLVRIAVTLCLAILFLQSGLDKVIDRKGNVDWLTGHFSKSPLASFVAPMLATITLVEVSAGALSAIGAVMLVLSRARTFAALGALLAVAGLLMLFFGQRMAKDYAGAAGLVPYILLACFGLGIMGIG
jgi:hypothetical protein